MRKLVEDKMKTLKDLKDLKEKAIKDICKNMKVEPDTLCDFGKLGLMSVRDLVESFYNGEKQEAIKWVKEWIFILNNEDKRTDEKAYTFGAINSFKQFFNITEEDKKNATTR